MLHPPPTLFRGRAEGRSFHQKALAQRGFAGSTVSTLRGERERGELLVHSVRTVFNADALQSFCFCGVLPEACICCAVQGLAKFLLSNTSISHVLGQVKNYLRILLIT